MRNIFNEAEMEASFKKYGYVIVPFIDSKEIASLTDDYFRTLDESGGRLGPKDEKHNSKDEITYDFTFIDKNIEYKKKVFDLLSTVFEKHTSKFLDNYKHIIANFIRKKTDGSEDPLQSYLLLVN